MYINELIDLKIHANLSASLSRNNKCLHILAKCNFI